GTMTDETGASVDLMYFKNKICPKLCYKASVTLFACYIGSSPEIIKVWVNQCKKIKSVEACTGNLWHNTFWGLYWCSGGWVEITTNGGFGPPPPPSPPTSPPSNDTGNDNSNNDGDTVGDSDENNDASNNNP